MSSATESFELGLKEKNSIHLGTRKCSTGQISKRKFRLFRCRRQFFLTEKTFYQSKKCSMPNKCSQPIHWSFFDDVAEIWSRYTNDKVSQSKLPRQCQIVTSISDAIPNEILQRRLFKGELSICEALLAYCAGDLGLIPAVGKSIVQYSDGFSSPRYKVEG